MLWWWQLLSYYNLLELSLSQALRPWTTTFNFPLCSGTWNLYPPGCHSHHSLLAKILIITAGQNPTWALCLPHLQEGMLSSSLSSCEMSVILVEAPPLPDPLVVLWDQLIDQQQDFVYKMDKTTTITCDETCWRAADFHSLTRWDVPDKW